MLPEAAAAFQICDEVYSDKCQNAFDRARDDTEREGVGVVFVPSLDIEGQESTEEGENRLPALTEVHGSCKEEDLEGGIARVDSYILLDVNIRKVTSVLTVVKKLSQWSTLMCPSRLRAIDRVKCLVQEQANRPGQVYPRRTIGIQGGIIVEHGKEVDDNEAEAAECDGIWSHGHGEAFNHDVRVEGLQDVLGRQGLVDAGIFVLVELLQVARPDIHHLDASLKGGKQERKGS